MSSLKDVSLKDVGLKDVSLKDVVVPKDCLKFLAILTKNSCALASRWQVEKTN